MKHLDSKLRQLALFVVPYFIFCRHSGHHHLFPVYGDELLKQRMDILQQ